MPGAYLELAPNQAGHDAVCSSEKGGCDTTPALFGFIANFNFFGFFGEQVNGNQVFFRGEKSLKLPLLSHIIIRSKKKIIRVV